MIIDPKSKLLTKPAINWKSKKILIGVAVWLLLGLLGFPYVCACFDHVSISTTNIGYLQSRAELGDTAAQNALGIMYEKGNGVKQDYAEAYFWISLAHVSYNSIPAEEAAVAQHLTPEQKVVAAKRVAKWVNEHPAPVAAPRKEP